MERGGPRRDSLKRLGSGQLLGLHLRLCSLRRDNPTGSRSYFQFSVEGGFCVRHLMDVIAGMIDGKTPTDTV